MGSIGIIFCERTLGFSPPPTYSPDADAPGANSDVQSVTVANERIARNPTAGLLFLGCLVFRFGHSRLVGKALPTILTRANVRTNKGSLFKDPHEEL